MNESATPAAALLALTRDLNAWPSMQPAQIAEALAVRARVEPGYSTVAAIPTPDGEWQMCSGAGPQSGALATAPLSAYRTLGVWLGRTGEAVVSPDLTLDLRLSHLGEHGLSGAYVAIPLGNGGFLLVLAEVGDWERLQAHLETWQAMAETADLAIGHTAIQRQANTHLRNLYAINEVSRLLVSAADPDSVLTLIVDVATSLLNLDLACVLMVQADGARRVAAARGLGSDRATGLVLAADAEVDEALLGVSSLGAFVTVPIRGRQHDLGELVAGRRQTGFSDQDKQLLDIWTSLASVALESSKAIEEVDAAHEAYMTLVVSALEARSVCPMGHAAEVAALASAVGGRMGLSPWDLRELRTSSLLHDLHLMGLEEVERWLAPANASTPGEAPAWATRLREAVRALNAMWAGETLSSNGGGRWPVAAGIVKAVHVYLDRRLGTPERPPMNPVAALLDVKALAGKSLDPGVLAALEAVVWARLGVEGQALPRRPDAAAPALMAEPPHQSPSPKRPEDGPPTRGLKPAGLTERETEVLNLVSLGLSNREIAARLYLSEATVKTHVSRVLQKLGLPDRTKAAVHALRRSPTS